VSNYQEIYHRNERFTTGKYAILLVIIFRMPKKELGISYIARAHGQEAAKLAQQISHAFASEGRGRFADRVVISLADSVERGDLRMSNRGFVYHDIALGRDMVFGEAGDDVLPTLTQIAIDTHRSKSGTLFSRIMRRLIPKSIIQENIRGVSGAVYQELVLREHPLYREIRQNR